MKTIIPHQSQRRHFPLQVVQVSSNDYRILFSLWQLQNQHHRSSAHKQQLDSKSTETLTLYGKWCNYANLNFTSKRLLYCNTIERVWNPFGIISDRPTYKDQQHTSLRILQFSSRLPSARVQLRSQFYHMANKVKPWHTLVSHCWGQTM